MNRTFSTRHDPNYYESSQPLDQSTPPTPAQNSITFSPLPASIDPQEAPMGSGVLDIADEGFGFLRSERFMPGPNDVYIAAPLIRRFGLRPGDMVAGSIRPSREPGQKPGLLHVEAVNELDPNLARRRPHFDSMTPIFPNQAFTLETDPTNLSGRLIDLVSPIGRGQRGLIVSPPKAGKTMLLTSIAASITRNHPDAYLMVALIGERPEEVTELQRQIKREVISSTFDEPSQTHTHLAEMVLERAKRLVESGRDVVILLDSLTRLSRAANLTVESSGRSLSGGLDPSAMMLPKRFFGAARKLEGAGSLTIIATALIETGSKMDDVIYEELKGTGNMELILNRSLAERRIFPAIDITRSGTRREELLYDRKTYQEIVVLRRMFSQLNDQRGMEAMGMFMQQLSKARTNAAFLAMCAKSLGDDLED